MNVEPANSGSLIDRLRPGIERAVEAFNRGDWDAAWGGVAPGFEFHPDPNALDGSILRGREALVNYFRAARDAFPDWQMQPVEFIEAGEGKLVVRGQLGGTGASSGLDVRADVYYVYETRDGRVVRMYEFLERQPAFEQAGIEG